MCSLAVLNIFFVYAVYVDLDKFQLTQTNMFRTAKKYNGIPYIPFENNHFSPSLGFYS